MKNGYIAGIGKAGNPDVMAGVTPGMVQPSPPRQAHIPPPPTTTTTTTHTCIPSFCSQCGVCVRAQITGVNTEAIGGEKLIVTAGGMDAHIHFICPQLADEAIASGLTTMLGGGTGPASGTTATTCTPSPAHVEMMLKATDVFPLNFAFTGKVKSPLPAAAARCCRRRSPQLRHQHRRLTGRATPRRLVA